MTKTIEKLDLREAHLLNEAGNLVDVLCRWNRIDLPELAIENRFTGTAYHHVTMALEKLLIELGVGADEKMDFYEMVRSGTSPAEAKQRILDYRPQGDGEE